MVSVKFKKNVKLIKRMFKKPVIMCVKEKLKICAYALFVCRYSLIKVHFRSVQIPSDPLPN